MNVRARIVRWAAVVAAALAIAPQLPGQGAAAVDDGPSSNLEVMLVIDVSSSMRPAIDAARNAADQFVASMPEVVSIGLGTFGDEVKVLTPPTTDRALLAELIEGIALEDDTALYDAVIESTKQFTPTVPEKVIVLLSDGRDEGSVAPLEYAVASLQGVRVEAISLTTEQTDLASLSALGAVTSADDAAGMQAAFARIAGLLAEVVVPVTTAPPAPSTSATVPSTTVVATTAAPVTTMAPRPEPVAIAAPDVDGSSLPLVLGGIVVFVALFLFVLVVFPGQRVSKARLGIEGNRSVGELSRRTAAVVDAALERRGSRTDLANALSVAKIGAQPGEFVGLVAAIAVVAGLLGLLAAGPVGGIAVAAIVCLGARAYVGRRMAKRREAFAEQLPDVLQLVTTALRSGFSLAQALEAVAEEAQEPAKSEFAQVLVEGRLGRDFPGAMRSLARRMRSEDLEWVVSAIEINRDLGGNLSEVLTAVANTIRERQRMNRQIATYTAEGRLSARVLTVLPFVMALWQWRANPDNFERLFSGGGLVALCIAGVLLVLGSAWIRRIVNSISV